jgi:hypothetical protein
MDTDIRITNMFIRTNDLAMWHFYFESQKDGEDTLIVRALRGWWNYQVEITFNNVVFSNCPKQLDFNILCRVATKEEERHLRSLHDFPPSYNVYCFEDTSEYFINGPVPRDASGEVDPEFVKMALNSLSLTQQQKSFVIAQSVKVTAFFSDRHFDDSFNTWPKGDISDLSEEFQKVFLGAIESSIRFAKSVEDEKRANRPHPDIDKQG